MSATDPREFTAHYADPALQAKVRKAIKKARPTLRRDEVDDLAQSAWAEVWARLKDGRLTCSDEAAICRIAMQVAVEETGLAVSRRTIDRIKAAEAGLGYDGTGRRPGAATVAEWTHANSLHDRDWVSAEAVLLARIVVGELNTATERVMDASDDPFEALLEEGAAICGRIERGEPGDRSSLALLAYLVTAATPRGQKSRGEKAEFTSSEIARILGVSLIELRQRKAILGAHIEAIRGEAAA